MEKGEQTRPERAGEQNLTAEIIDAHRDEEAGALLAMIAPIFKKSVGSPTQNRKPNWTPDELRTALSEYFEYFAYHGLKPSKSSIRLWLGVGTMTYHNWETQPNRFGELTEIVQLANDVLETQYINRGESFPTMNTFLLKSSHGHRDSQRLEVESVERVDKSNIDDMISKSKLAEDIMEKEVDEVGEKEIE